MESVQVSRDSGQLSVFLSAVCPGFLPGLMHVNEIVLVAHDRAIVSYKPTKVSLGIIKAEWEKSVSSWSTYQQRTELSSTSSFDC